MPKQSAVPGILAVAALTLAVPLAAQERSSVTGPELEAAVLARSGRRQENRAAVQRFLGRDDVRRAAQGLGLKLDRVSASIATLDDQTVNGLADRTRAAERQLAGGDVVIISTTAIIIGLLILIIILVA